MRKTCYTCSFFFVFKDEVLIRIEEILIPFNVWVLKTELLQRNDYLYFSVLLPLMLAPFTWDGSLWRSQDGCQQQLGLWLFSSIHSKKGHWLILSHLPNSKPIMVSKGILCSDWLRLGLQLILQLLGFSGNITDTSKHNRHLPQTILHLSS
jgi:hypothetical protein